MNIELSSKIGLVEFFTVAGDGESSEDDNMVGV